MRAFLRLSSAEGCSRFDELRTDGFVFEERKRMSDAVYGPKPLFPALGRFYDFAIPFSWLVIQVAVGWNLIVHGWGKIQRGISPVAPAFTQMGFEPGIFWAWLSTILEFAGGICILLGLFTRF